MNRIDESEISELFKRLNAGERQVEEFLVLHFSSLVKSMARRFHRYTGMDKEDLEQIGYIGLIKALEKFDPLLGVKFSTYATSLIIGEIRTSLRKHLRLAGLMAGSDRGTMEKKHFLPEVLKVDEIAGAAGISREEAAADSRYCYRLFFPGDEILNRITRDETVYDPGFQKIWLKEALTGLEPDERKIIFYRYFQEKSQQEVARLTGSTQKQVSRLEKMILGKMKEQMSFS